MNSKLILPLLFLTTACGSGSDNRDSADKESGILGSWSSTCKVIGHTESDSSDVSTPLEAEDTFGIVTITFEESGQLTTESSEYTDDTCSRVVQETAPLSASYQLGEMLVTDSGLQAQQIDVTFPPPGSLSTVYGIIRSEGNILYLSEFDETTRQNSLNLTTPYYKN